MVHLDNLVYSAGGVGILSGITLSSAAPLIGVIGRNGSGKSTLARLICGLLTPDSGTVCIGGIDVLEDRAAAIRTVGILFQNPEHQIIFPTVQEEIGFGLSQLGYGKTDVAAKTDDILRRFGRTHWKEAPVNALSQGQKHLVCIMALLAMEPRLLVLDEPFAGLDIPTRMQLVRHLQGCKISLLHITHDTRDLEGYDEIYWLEQGRICASGPHDKILPAFTEEMIRIGGEDDLSDLTG